MTNQPEPTAEGQEIARLQQEMELLQHIKQLQADLAQARRERDEAREDWRETEAEMRHSAGRNAQLLADNAALQARLDLAAQLYSGMKDEREKLEARLAAAEAATAGGSPGAAAPTAGSTPGPQLQPLEMQPPSQPG